MMMMISAFIVKITPTEASNVMKVEISVPPIVVTAPPSANASADIFGTLMPTRPLASVLTDTARMAMPGRVK